MMKYLILLISLLAATVSAQAMQCPPSRSLSHSGKGQPWSLQSMYENQGWYVSRDVESEEDSLIQYDPRGAVQVRLIQAEAQKTSPYYAQCRYVDNTNAIGAWITLYNSKVFNLDVSKLQGFRKTDHETESQNHVPADFNADYYCDSDGNTTENCQW